MIFNWYKVFNLADIPDEIISKTFTVNLAGIGEVNLLVSVGVTTSITYDGVLLPLLFNGENPFIGLGEKYAVYKDSDDYVFLGFRTEE